MSEVRDKFVARFGEDNAAAVERAADGHKNGVHDNPGSDPFKWALLICIGFQCMTDYQKGHEIDLPTEPVLRSWVRQNADLVSHDGDYDYLAAFAGAYEGWYESPLSADAASWSAKENG